MNHWGDVTYGDPCRECGFSWEVTVEDAVTMISSAPEAYGEVLRHAGGHESTPELALNAVAYVAHVADNLRFWGE